MVDYKYFILNQFRRRIENMNHTRRQWSFVKETTEGIQNRSGRSNWADFPSIMFFLLDMDVDYPQYLPCVKSFIIPNHSAIIFTHDSSFLTLAGPKRRTQNAGSGTRVPNARGLIVACNASEPCRSFFVPRKKDALHHRDVFKHFLVASSTIWVWRSSQTIFFAKKKGFRPNPICEKEVSPKPSERRLESAH